MHRRALPRSRKNPDQSDISSYGERFCRLNLKGSKQLGLVTLCLASVLGFNLVFAIWNPGLFWLVPGSLPFTAILGAVLYFFSDLLCRLQARMAGGIGRVQAAFLSFFLILLAVVIVYYLFLALPMGFLLKTFADGSLALDYRRWSLDLAALQSLVFWAWAVCRRV